MPIEFLESKAINSRESNASQSVGSGREGCIPSVPIHGLEGRWRTSFGISSYLVNRFDGNWILQIVYDGTLDQKLVEVCFAVRPIRGIGGVLRGLPFLHFFAVSSHGGASRDLALGKRGRGIAVPIEELFDNNLKGVSFPIEALF